MSPKYFQGRTVTGQVEASTAHSWRDVVERFRVPSTLPFTRQAFFAMDEDQRQRAKHVPFFTPATFAQSPSQRNYQNARPCNLIFLDIDPEKVKLDGKWVETGRCPAAPFVRDPGAIHKALHGFNFVAHTTASSTPEKPRMRVVLEAHVIPPERYPQAVQTVAALLGLPSITTESKVAVQPMFLPTLFQDSNLETDDPVLAFSYDGRAFTVEDISTDAVLPTNGHSHSGGKNGHKLPTFDPTGDALFFLKAPLPEVTIAVAKEALATVNPDCSYHEWLEIAAALKHQFCPRAEDEAYALFDEWSEQGTKYVSDTETRAKWDSLRSTPVGRMPITIRTLLRAAAASGWNDNKLKDQSYNSIITWMGDALTITDLVEEGVRKILAAPQLSSMQEGMLIDQLRLQAKDRFGYKVAVADIRADLKRIRAEVRLQERSQEKVKEPTWAKGVLYVSSTQEFFRHHTGERYKAEAFNAIYARHLLPTVDQLKEQGIPPTPANLSRPTVSPTDYALNHLKLPTGYDYAYDPSQPNEVWFVTEGRKLVNLYRPSYPELDHKRKAEAGRIFQHHLATLVAEPEYRTILTDFLAYQVQFPGIKVRWAVLIQGVDGAGKTYFAEAMKAVLGSEHVKLVNGESVKSSFNEWSFGSQFVILEEVRVIGTNRHEIMNALKPLITNDEIAVNEKFRNTRKIRNVSNYMMFSNFHDALSLSHGDRRYFVVKSRLQSKRDVESLGDNYFPPLFENLRLYPGALRAYLNEWEISSSFRADGHAPRTKYAEEMISDSASELASHVKQMLLDGDHPLVQYDIVSSKALMDMLRMEDGIKLPTMQQVSHVLRDEGFVQCGRHQFGSAPGERHYLWTRGQLIGAVEEAQRRFKENKKNLHMEIIFT